MDRYLFLHVAKTAGTSVMEAFRRLLGPENVSPVVSIHFDALNLDEISKYRLVAGHFHYNQVAHFPNRRLLTFLRDPVDVVVSKYHFFRNNGDLNQPLVRLCKQYSFAEWLDRGEQAKTFFNEAVWRFAGIGPAVVSLKDDDALTLAKDHLATCDFIGIYEHMTESLDLMSYTFGWPQLDELSKENVTNGRPKVGDLDPKIVARILDLNRLDAELYRYAVQLLKERKRSAWKTAIELKRADRKLPGLISNREPALTGRVLDPHFFEGPLLRAGSGAARIVSVQLSSDRKQDDGFAPGAIIDIRVLVLAHATIAEASIGIRVLNAYGQMLYGLRSIDAGKTFRLVQDQVTEVVFRIAAKLMPASYKITAEITSGEIGLHELIDYFEECATLEISGRTASGFRGLVDVGLGIWGGPADNVAYRYELGTPIQFNSSGQSRLYAVSGWGDPEAWARWTDGTEASLLLRLDRVPRNDLVLSALAVPYCPADKTFQDVDIYANGQKIQTWRVPRSEEHQSLKATIPYRIMQQLLSIVFCIHDPRSPAALGSDDNRKLGLAFLRIQIDETNPVGCPTAERLDAPVTAPAEGREGRRSS